ncbi:MAG: sigma-70 family RNA polymerase sigma factor [Acidobacteria bacterium]|nr:sigma-70 family RNA polymerase sigma factor [Acidobacteriota bacterium]
MSQIRHNLENQNPVLLPKALACDQQQFYLTLLAQIAQGEAAALDALYQQISPVVFGLILRITGDRARAEEVLLEVFKQVWRQAALYDAKQTTPLAWILALARTRALDCRRSASVEPRQASPFLQEPLRSVAASEVEATAFLAQQQHLARTALAALPVIQRQVVELSYYSGLSPHEIAIRLNLSPDTVIKLLRLAMMKLREFLNPMLQEQL